MVKVLILRSAGINCNDELEQGFKMAGADTEQVHVNELVNGKHLNDFDVLALPGGFSYGDYLAAGTILANELSVKLRKEISDFIDKGKLVVGICNGFQTLVKTGFLPGEGMKANLAVNESGNFECRWITMTSDQKHLTGVEELEAPVAHGEGRFMADSQTLEQLEANGQVIFRYSGSDFPENPNGSLNNIAGISNKKGNVIGMMPHPERHLTVENHPQHLKKINGLQFFQNIVERAK